MAKHKKQQDEKQQDEGQLSEPVEDIDWRLNLKDQQPEPVQPDRDYVVQVEGVDLLGIKRNSTFRSASERDEQQLRDFLIRTVERDHPELTVLRLAWKDLETGEVHRWAAPEYMQEVDRENEAILAARNVTKALERFQEAVTP